MEYNALLLEKEGHQIEESILSALKQSDVLNCCYAYKSRVKPEEKLIEKVKIKQGDGRNDYDIKNITDVVGLRLITLFRVDMVELVEKIIKILKHGYCLEPNPFKKDSIEEFIFYSNRNKDKINLLLKDLAVKHEVEDKYEMIQRGGEYSSIHIVARTSKRINKLSSSGKIYYFPVEIQIRTVFEDAWGEVDHKYGYPIRTGKQTKYKIYRPLNIERHLDTLKRFSDACGEYADAIHLEIMDDNQEEIGIANLKPVESDQETIELFKRLDVSPTEIAKYIEARAIRQEGLQKKRTREEGGSDLLREAAKVFKELNENHPANEKDEKKLFAYYTRMNYAFCLLSTNLKKEASEALQVYSDVEKEYPSFLLVKMRLSQAYEKNKLLDLCLKNCDEAYRLYKVIDGNGFMPSEELPEVDFNHIRKYLAKIYGYFLWKKSENIKNKSNEAALAKVKILKKAFYLTEEALVHDQESESLYNNLMYYALQMINLSKEYPKISVNKKIRESIDKNLKELTKKINIYESDSVNLLDTLAKVYDYLGEREERDKIIGRLIPIAEKTFSEQDCDNEIIQTIIEEAKAMLAGDAG